MIALLVVLLNFVTTITAEEGLVQYQAMKPRQFFYSFQDSCKSQKLRDLPLIEAHSLLELDCMGKIIPASVVCIKKSEEMEERPKLLRGFVRADKKDIVCEFGEGAVLNLLCKDGYKELCKDPKKSCLELKKKYSVEVPLWKSTVNEKPFPGPSELNCYFSIVETLVK